MSEIVLYARETLQVITPRILRPPDRKTLESTQISWAHYKATHAPQILPDFHEWDWLKKKGAAYAASLFGLEYAGELQGLLSVADRPLSARTETGASALYVEFLEAAPWNHRLYAGSSARFLDAGTALLSLANQLSVERGCHGCVALHSIPSASDFYMKQGLREFPDDDMPGLRYFELSPSGLGGDQ